MDPNFLKSAVLIEISTKLNLLQPIDKTENSEICIERAHSSIINHFFKYRMNRIQRGSFEIKILELVIYMYTLMVVFDHTCTVFAGDSFVILTIVLNINLITRV